MKSELVELDIVGSDGSTHRYYTYDGYYDENDRKRIRHQKRKVEKRTFTLATFTGLLTFYASKRVQMPTFSYHHNRIPTKGLVSGVSGFFIGYLLFDFIGTRQLAQLQNKVAMGSKHLPLWKRKHLAVNPDRVFFQLVDSNDNQISIFHSGLTPDAAARLIPDKILGSAPSKPKKPTDEKH